MSPLLMPAAGPGTPLASPDAELALAVLALPTNCDHVLAATTNVVMSLAPAVQVASHCAKKMVRLANEIASGLDDAAMVTAICTLLTDFDRLMAATTNLAISLVPTVPIMPRLHVQMATQCANEMAQLANELASALNGTATGSDEQARFRTMGLTLREIVANTRVRIERAVCLALAKGNLPDLLPAATAAAATITTTQRRLEAALTPFAIAAPVVATPSVARGRGRGCSTARRR